MAAGLSVLVVEDHDILREATVSLLARAGHRAVGVDCAEALAEATAGLSFDLFVIDINLPGEDGLSLARRLRATQPLAGIVIMTARGALPDRLAGYESGADLYLSKPVEPAELLAAIASLGRRVVEAEARASSPQPPRFSVDIGGRWLSGPGGEETLTPSEATLLAAFARARLRRLETWQLMELLGEDPQTYAKSALEVRILRLRQKLVRVGADDGCLKALRGYGYELAVPIGVR